MQTQIKQLEFDDSGDFSHFKCNSRNEIGPLSHINLFIGQNNSGKSRFLRFLFCRTNLKYTTDIYDYQTFSKFLEKINQDYKLIFGNDISSIGPFYSVEFDTLISPDKKFISTDNSVYEEIINKLNAMQNISNGQVSHTRGYGVNPDQVFERLRNFGEDSINKLPNIDFTKSILGNKRYYIPILRGMRPFDNEHTNFYHSRTVDDYFISSEKKVLVNDDLIIFTGLELFSTLKKKLLGEPEDREEIANFEKFLSRHFFNNKKFTLIPKEGTNTVHVKIGQEKQFPLYNLGDGLQNLIIITFPIFIERERCLYFIEEPDMFMHPGYQRTLMQTFSLFDQHQFFISTHSNHFLDMTIDYPNISIFQFHKDEQHSNFSINPISNKDNNLLRELGVRNSSVFLTNASIWVEGITDRLYLRAYLKKYIQELNESDNEKYNINKNFKEDIHYSIVEYQGSNLVHWSFDKSKSETDKINTRFLCAEAFVIADGDITDKGNRKEEFEKALGDKVYFLNCKEIENLIPHEILTELLKLHYKKIKIEINKNDYNKYSESHEGLGRFLDKKNKEKFIGTSTGTVKNKLQFCFRAIEIMDDKEIEWKLPENIKEICEKILLHIKSNNS